MVEERIHRPHMMSMLGCALLLLSTAAAEGQQAGRREFTLRGRVEEVYAGSQSIRVNHEAVEGLMGAMTMTFPVQPSDILRQLKAGDRIIGTLYEGEWTLHNVRIDAEASETPADEPAPISYICPTPGEETVIEDAPGTCPGSGAALVPVRLVTAYSCLRVQLPLRDAPGICPVDRTPLVPVTAAMFFTCDGDPTTWEADAGSCPDGRPRVRRLERRAHGDHNPRHGGPFMFMSANQLQHVEATVVEPGIVRVYFYDDMTRPLPTDGISGRLARTDENAQEIGPPMPLVDGANPDGSMLEARVGELTFPFRVKIRVQFKPGEPEQVYDYTFQDWSREP